MRRLHSLIVAALICVLPAIASAQSTISPIMTGDEPIVITTHRIQTPDGPLDYEARAGRLAIRVDETGEVHGHVFFVAYVVKNRGANRPLTIAWNGGPTVPSIYVHTEFLGPRLVTPKGFVDNPLTLLRSSDLVFYDPVQTGFSRVAKPEFAPEFFNMKGDIAVAAEFVRAYRARFDAQTQPLFLLGESYGVWRAGAVAQFLAERGLKVTGLIFVSGGFPSITMPMTFWKAMNVQGRTATAIHYKRLAPELLRDPIATAKASDAWVRSTYLPALNRIEALQEPEREAIASSLARYTGYPADKIDRRTLVISTNDYLKGFFAGDPARELADVDTRVFGEEKQPPERHLYISKYLRRELGYATDLGYTGQLGYGSDLGYRALEAGYVPTPGPARRSSGRQWTYNQSDTAQAALAEGISDGELGHMFNANPPWTQAAMKLLPEMRVFVALGRYDPTNVCEGQVLAIETLPADQQRRIVTHCYDGGHMMFRDYAARVKISDDLAGFVSSAIHDQMRPASAATVNSSKHR
jgi:carboxypeptidase C (cathepsin A)